MTFCDVTSHDLLSFCQKCMMNVIFELLIMVHRCHEAVRFVGADVE